MPIETKVAETMDLLRYLLRLNSTKVEPDPWQLANLPLGEDSPWMASFISPLYSELILDCCKMFTPVPVFEKMQQQQQPNSISYADSRHCAACFKEDVGLKKCSKCMSILYCSADCQIEHWNTHKPSCFELRKLSSISSSDC